MAFLAAKAVWLGAMIQQRPSIRGRAQRRRARKQISLWMTRRVSVESEGGFRKWLFVFANVTGLVIETLAVVVDTDNWRSYTGRQTCPCSLLVILNELESVP